MKYYELVQVVKYLKNFKKIDALFRVEDTVIKVVFDRKKPIFFDMTKGNSTIFKKDDYKVAKSYNAPFDVVLNKRCAQTFINDIEILENNKIVRFFLEQRSSYKSLKTILQFEFTGRHTNVIICDEDFKIVEALRHIDLRVSYREIQNGLRLPDLPPMSIREEYKKIEDIESYLEEIYKEKEEKKLFGLKNQKLISTQKKIEKLQKMLDSLEDSEKLLDISAKLQLEAQVLLANLGLVDKYQREFKTEDFDGNSIVIKLPKEAKTPADAANILFNLSKKAKQKSKNIHIEKENLLSKIEYLKRLQEIIKETKSIDELKLYFPKKEKKGKREKRYDGVEVFYYDDYKISLGKNERANAYLLKNAKMSDIWLHLKDRPSTHVIISSNKKSVKDNVLKFAANLCAKFSLTQKGSYLVDYTTRRDVKIISGAKVNYVNYKTISVTI